MELKVRYVPIPDPPLQTRWKICALEIDGKSPALQALIEWSRESIADYRKIMKVLRLQAEQKNDLKIPNMSRKVPIPSMAMYMNSEPTGAMRDCCFFMMKPDSDDLLNELLANTPKTSADDLKVIADASSRLKDDPAFIAELNKSRFIETLWQSMNLQGITQSELARKWGKTRQYVSKVFQEDRRVNFTIESMSELCHLLNLHLDIRALQETECPHVMTVSHQKTFTESTPTRVLAVRITANTRGNEWEPVYREPHGEYDATAVPA